MNNTIHKSTGTSPSQLLFGVNQRGIMIDHLREKLEEIGECQNKRDLVEIRK